MKLEIHLIQSFGPSCLNRDDTNSPKDCIFGDKRRARISSQSFKRAMRGYFRTETQVPVGERTKRLRGEVGSFLSDLDAEIVPFAVDAFVDTYFAKNDSKKPQHSSVLLFLSRVELEEIAKCIRDGWAEIEPVAIKRKAETERIEASNDKAKKKGGADVAIDEGAESEKGAAKFEFKPEFKVKGGKTDKAVVARLTDAALSADIALFGRMLAEHTEHKIEGAAQVAHAISTHAAAPEFDFFSAVDDLNQDDAGAGMLGVTGFNAACFYRYALVDFDALLKNLKGDRETAIQTVEAFCHAFVKAIPGGKQNSMAAQNLPDMGFFVVRESGSPCSLVNAFCNPVRPGKDEGLIEKSVDGLVDYWKRYTGVYGTEGIKATSLFSLGEVSSVSDLGTPTSLKAAIETAVNALV